MDLAATVFDDLSPGFFRLETSLASARFMEEMVFSFRRGEVLRVELLHCPSKRKNLVRRWGEAGDCP